MTTLETIIVAGLILAAITYLIGHLWWENRKLTNTSKRLFDTEVALSNLEHYVYDTTADLDVPDVDDPADAPTTPTYRPVPEHFNEWR